ncbi:MAG: AMP-binding protein, partial [Symploca sp. SIO2E9]|nr:AMP-binding protein [Symploca sp. SIO2E9]
AVKDPACWLDLIVKERVTIWNSVPTLMQMLVEYLSARSEIAPLSLRLALLSGDWLPLKLPEQIQAHCSNLEIVSLGGATEASIWSICYPITTVNSNWKSIPYGKPLTNQSVYVFNELMEPTPVWVPGQLYIGGIGLALGYWGDEDKTKASFITHPDRGECLYKTGDLGRYLPDGNIEFLGREDFQVKINGYRIEFGEIEAALKQHPAIKQAVVAAVGEELNKKQLVAYVVSDQELTSAQNSAEAYQPSQLLLYSFVGGKIDLTQTRQWFSTKADQGYNSINLQLREYLQQKLPKYMLPSEYIILDSLPLTSNGKVDRKMLPSPEIALNAEAILTPPKTEMEWTLAKIVQELLQLETVGVESNFFQLGMDSLKLVQLKNKLLSSLGVNVSIKQLLTEATNIAELAVTVEDYLTLTKIQSSPLSTQSSDDTEIIEL